MKIFFKVILLLVFFSTNIFAKNNDEFYKKIDLFGEVWTK